MIQIQETTRAAYVRADDAGKIADMPEVLYYGTRMFTVTGTEGMARKDIADAVADYADPKRVNRDRK